MPKERIEKDALGEVAVPTDRYWGAQTQRALTHFQAGAGRDLLPAEMIQALGLVKNAAALANQELGLLPSGQAALIVAACDEVIAGKLDAHFPVSLWQSGSGTQSNMNANEVIARRAWELAGERPGAVLAVHPNDHVNMSQSTNDTFPTAMHLAAVQVLRGELLPSVADLLETLREKSRRFQDIVKIGRTHLMDAVPLTLGQEISGWCQMLDNGLRRVELTLPHLHELALGGTVTSDQITPITDFYDKLRKAQVNNQPMFVVSGGDPLSYRQSGNQVTWNFSLELRRAEELKP